MTFRPALLQSLARTRLLGGATWGNVGAGERRSRQKGPGIEFADYREYEPGDDLRYLDLQHYVRRGELAIRQYEVTRSLSVAVIVDNSLSMNFGSPDKMAMAIDLAQIFAFAGLAGGDVVQCWSGAGKGLRRSPRASGIDRAQVAFEWLHALSPEDVDFRQTLKLIAATLSPGALVIVISDFWSDVADADLARLRNSGATIVAVQVAAPQEEEPSLTAAGDLRLEDVETGDEIDIAADGRAFDAYRREYRRWNEEIRARFLRHGFRHLRVRSDANLETLALVDWKREGILS